MSTITANHLISFFASYFLARIFFPRNQSEALDIFFSKVTYTPHEKSNGRPLTQRSVLLNVVKVKSVIILCKFLFLFFLSRPHHVTCK